MKVLTIFGTRPETIKLAPVIKELKKYPEKITSRICVTAQHREMLDPFLKLFNIKPDYDLDIMKHDQTLFDITANILIRLRRILENEKPDIILVQGDTTTAFVASLAAYYLKIIVGHVEAGLRSGDTYNPFPEEMNRKLIDHIASLHFVPTPSAKKNLLKEGIAETSLFITGNTVVDALFMVLEMAKELRQDQLDKLAITNNSRILLVTGHRRESFGEGLENICKALTKIVEHNKDIEIIYPVHLNPNVQEAVHRILDGIDRIHLIEPLDYVSFVQVMAKSYLILTDSGGVQEEAPSLHKPILVMRNATERPEVVEVGAAKLVGTYTDSIVRETSRLLSDAEEYARMAKAPNPFGDGFAAQRIVNVLMSKIEKL